ncbi:MAG: CydX/CbdX family cytochrome bd oxidase small subunit [Sphingomonas sp.]
MWYFTWVLGLGLAVGFGIPQRDVARISICRSTTRARRPPAAERRAFVKSRISAARPPA